jgi:hypothetical protein
VAKKETTSTSGRRTSYVSPRLSMRDEFLTLIDFGNPQVTWDDKSLFINGERLMIFSAEIHAFR